MARVLIVEDEQDVAELVDEILRLDGHEVREASGVDARRVALEFQPAVVVLDLMMPQVDGFEVARQIRAEPSLQTVPIVVMTAMYDAANKAKLAGTPLYVAKPFDMLELMEVIRTAARVASG